MDTIQNGTTVQDITVQDTTVQETPKAKAPKAKAPKAAKAPKVNAQAQAQAQAQAELDAKVAKALEGLTPEQALANLLEKKAKLSAAANKAHATRKLNGTASGSAKSAWITRRAVTAAMEALAAKVKAVKAPKAKAPKLVKAS